MGLRGPPPKPTATKRLEGTFRPDRAAVNEVVAPPGTPKRPNMPDDAIERWEELVPTLLERGTLSIEDGAILEAHCRAYALWRRYQDIAERAPIIRGNAGSIKVNPAAAEARLWEARATTTGDRLGLNASARSRVSARDGSGSVQGDKDPAEEFLFGPRLVKDG